MEFVSTGPRVEIKEAFEAGLRQKFGDAMGGILAEVMMYYPGVTLDGDKLQEILDADVAPVMNGILSNAVTGPVMRGIRSQLITSALLADRAAVVRWAQQGLNRCERAGGDWAATLEQWKWVQENPDRFIVYSRQIKYLLNQL